MLTDRAVEAAQFHHSIIARLVYHPLGRAWDRNGDWGFQRQNRGDAVWKISSVPPHLTPSGLVPGLFYYVEEQCSHRPLRVRFNRTSLATNAGFLAVLSSPPIPNPLSRCSEPRSVVDLYRAQPLMAAIKARMGREPDWIDWWSDDETGEAYFYLPDRLLRGYRTLRAVDTEEKRLLERVNLKTAYSDQWQKLAAAHQRERDEWAAARRREFDALRVNGYPGAEKLLETARKHQKELEGIEGKYRGEQEEFDAAFKAAWAALAQVQAEERLSSRA